MGPNAGPMNLATRDTVTKALAGCYQNADDFMHFAIIKCWSAAELTDYSLVTLYGVAELRFILVQIIAGLFVGKLYPEPVRIRVSRTSAIEL